MFFDIRLRFSHAVLSQKASSLPTHASPIYTDIVCGAFGTIGRAGLRRPSERNSNNTTLQSPGTTSEFINNLIQTFTDLRAPEEGDYSHNVQVLCSPASYYHGRHSPACRSPGTASRSVLNLLGLGRFRYPHISCRYVAFLLGKSDSPLPLLTRYLKEFAPTGKRNLARGQVPNTPRVVLPRQCRARDHGSRRAVR